MIQKDLETAELLVKETLGDLTEEELKRLEDWKNDRPELYSAIFDPENIRQQSEIINSFSEDEGWRQVQSHIDGRKKSPLLWTVMRYSAVAAVLIAVCLTMVHNRRQDSPDIVASTSQIPDVRVTTSLGEDTQITLPDGSRIMLNSMSSLEYPEQFSEDRRIVTLIGEAYLEVSPSDVPFIVKTCNADIEVLGTVFNVSAYPDERCSTTLVSGSVRVSAHNGTSAMLSPSQRAVIDSDNNMTVDDVDTDLHTSWTKGKILFRDERLEDIMTKMSRWYDFSVDYQNESVKNLRFGCYVDRYDKIEDFVSLITSTGRIMADKNGKKYYFHN